MVGNVMATKKIKNIIFDLGGVIINLDMQATIKAFVDLGINDFENIYSQLSQTSLFDQFDKGLITENYFFNSLKNQFDLKKPLHELERSWNAMLLDFPKHRLDSLMTYKKSHRTFLLSNTNETHIREFYKTLQDNHGMRDLDQFFDKTYFSCRVNMRKPDKEIFELVLKQNHLDPSETLFIDDTIHHVEGAKRVGLQAVLLKKGEEFDEVLKRVL
jgi:putative hydrolase of the HAD superfamily